MRNLKLAASYHRVAASRRLGLETVEAEVRTGSRHDALRYAARVGAAQRGISPEEAVSYIERYARAADPPVTEYTTFAEYLFHALR